MMIKEAPLRSVVEEETATIRENIVKWKTRAKALIEKGWYFIEDREELYGLIIKQLQLAQREINSVDFWVERWGSQDRFLQKIFQAEKDRMKDRMRRVKLCRIFVLSKEQYIREKVKEIMRNYKRDVSSEFGKPEVFIVIRNELRERHSELLKVLQHVVVFDDSVAIIELSDQFGESTGIGSIIGREVKVTQEEKREKGIYGGAGRYLEVINLLKQLADQKDTGVFRLT